jgi:hypothetical protein
VLLVGLVAKNSILLVDITNQLRATGAGVDEALLEACPRRLRPILMTSLTIIGMTSEVSQHGSRLLAQALPHGCLAMLALLAGFVGHLVSPVLLITTLTAVSVLQVGVSLRRTWVDQNAMAVQNDEVPAFGSEPGGAEPISSRGAKMPRPKSIHLFADPPHAPRLCRPKPGVWPKSCERCRNRACFERLQHSKLDSY